MSMRSYISCVVNRIVHWEYTPISILVLFVSSLHFSTIIRPDYLVFDEKWYVPEAQAILYRGEGFITVVHPPLGKAFIVLGMFIFGDSPLGWRFFPVLFGIASIVLFYLVCRQLGLSRFTSWFATLLLATENLFYVLSSIAMLDVFSFTLVLFAFYLYLKGNYKLMGVGIGIATLAKLTGFLALPIIALHWFLTRRKEKQLFWELFLIPPVTFFSGLFFLDWAIFFHFVNPFVHTWEMLSDVGNPTFSTAFADNFELHNLQLSRPWEWVMSFKILGYSTKYIGSGEWAPVIYYIMLNPAIWVMIIPATIINGFLAFKRQNGALFAFIWFCTLYFFWVLLTIAIDRTTYLFYFYPCLGAVSIGIALGIEKLRTVKGRFGFWGLLLILCYILLILLSSIFMLPGWLWIKISFSIIAFIFMFFSLTQFGWWTRFSNSI